MATSLVRIGHAYGNTRHSIDLACAARVDSIEADLWYRDGDIYARHDRRLSPLPLLADRKMRGHPLPPYSIQLIKGYYVRPDINPIKLPELLERTQAGPRLLLDVKGGTDDEYARAFARLLAKQIRGASAIDRVEVCGQLWSVLTHLGSEAPEIDRRFSIETPNQWSEFLQITNRQRKTHDVCIEHRFLTDQRLTLLKNQGASVYTWTVDRRDLAQALIERGVNGIISNNLQLLSSIAGARA
jgi:glycerophosphoryl diester phosphodiesterase